MLSKFFTTAKTETHDFKTPFIIGWTGMRGVVSLAAALSIPVYLNNGNGFPQRNLILFITFVVILLTLVIQGLTLPYFVKKMQFDNTEDTVSRDEAYNQLRQELREYALNYLKTTYSAQVKDDVALQQLIQKWEHLNKTIDDDPIGIDIKVIYLDLLNKQRKWLRNRNKEDQSFDESIIKRHIHYLDVEEEKLRYM